MLGLKSWLQVIGLGSQKALDGAQDCFQTEDRGPLLIRLAMPSAVGTVNKGTEKQ